MTGAPDPGPDLTGTFLASITADGVPAESRVRRALREYRAHVETDPRIILCDVRARVHGDTATLTGRVLFPTMKAGLEHVLERAGVQADINGVELLPSVTLSGNQFALVKAPICDVRRTLDDDSERVSSALYGEPILLLTEERNRYLVQTAVGYLGWMPPECLKVVDHQAWREWHVGSRAILQRAIEIGADEVPMGAMLPRINDSHVRAVSGEIVDVSRDALRSFDAANSSLRRTAVETAERYLGVTYKWGGRSMGGIDCSGFIQMIYRNLGIALSRDANQQILTGTIVANRDWRTEMLPGDLLFFTNHIGKISHVALSMGGSKFIHASSERGVSCNSLDANDELHEKQLDERFVLAKRILI